MNEINGRLVYVSQGLGPSWLFTINPNMRLIDHFVGHIVQTLPSGTPHFQQTNVRSDPFPHRQVNVFGFLALDVLSSASESGTSGNYGLPDQILGLTWTRENILPALGASKEEADQSVIHGTLTSNFSDEAPVC